MRQLSAVALLGMLQQHGLTVDALEDLVYMCERHYTGPLTLHLVEGMISLLECQGKRRLTCGERALTKP